MEIVNGVVIGEFTRLYVLLTPNGTEQARRSWSSDEEGRAWANAEREKAIAQVGAIEAQHLWQGRKWELRIYE